VSRLAIFRRAGQSLIGLVGIVVLVFVLVRVTGDPAYLMLPEDATEQQRQEYRERQGLDQPVPVQLAIYVGNMAQGDFGTSTRRQEPAIDAVLRAFPVTLKLAGVTLVVSLAISLVVGSLAAYRRNSLVDRVATFLSLFAASAPDFWVAISGIFIFSVALGWLPTSGMGPSIAFWILPVATLSLRITGVLTQVVRSAMLSALQSAYIKTARAKGIRESSIIFIHALRNAALPIVTVAGDQLAGIVNGAVIVETVFGWPGIGKVAIDSIIERDFTVVQAVVIVTGIAIFAMNLLIDFIYVALDPRLRTA